MPTNILGANAPLWQPVQPAQPVTIKATATTAPRSLQGWTTTAFLMDPQIQYLEDNGRYINTHDERALAAALMVLREANPHEVVYNGDMIDLAAMSRHAQYPNFAGQTQKSLDRLHRLLVEVNCILPRAKKWFMEGNHDLRILTYILQNAMAAAGLRRANSPDLPPALSMENLLRLDELGVDYISGYPAGELWLGDDTVVIHGYASGGRGSTAAKYLDDRYASANVWFGHTHRRELLTRRATSSGRSVERFGANPGTLCRIDGAVPSVKGGRTSNGTPVKVTENWTQGIGLMHRRKGEQPIVELVPINDGVAYFRGKLLRAPASVKNEPLASVTRFAA